MRLKEQVAALSLVADWYDKRKVEITNTDNSPAMNWVMWGNLFWDRKDIQVEGLFVTTLPNVEPFFISIMQSTIWFIVVCLLIVVLLKRLEVN